MGNWLPVNSVMFLFILLNLIHGDNIGVNKSAPLICEFLVIDYFFDFFCDAEKIVIVSMDSPKLFCQYQEKYIIR